MSRMPACRAFASPHRHATPSFSCRARTLHNGSRPNAWRRFISPSSPLLCLERRSAAAFPSSFRGSPHRRAHPYIHRRTRHPTDLRAPRRGVCALRRSRGEDLHLSLTLDQPESLETYGFHDFELAYELILGHTLTARLSVANTGEQPLFFEEGAARLSGGGRQQLGKGGRFERHRVPGQDAGLPPGDPDRWRPAVQGGDGSGLSEHNRGAHVGGCCAAAAAAPRQGWIEDDGDLEPGRGAVGEAPGPGAGRLAAVCMPRDGQCGRECGYAAAPARRMSWKCG